MSFEFETADTEFAKSWLPNLEDLEALFEEKRSKKLLHSGKYKKSATLN